MKSLVRITGTSITTNAPLGLKTGPQYGEGIMAV